MVFDMRRFLRTSGLFMGLAVGLLVVSHATGCTSKTMEADPDNYVGVGIELTMVANGARVVRVLPDSAAARAGLAQDDVIMRIDETSARGLGLAEVVDLLRGQAGTKVAVVVAQKNGTLTKDLVRTSLKNR